jgi:hypothetical protein
MRLASTCFVWKACSTGGHGPASGSVAAIIATQSRRRGSGVRGSNLTPTCVVDAAAATRLIIERGLPSARITVQGVAPGGNLQAARLIGRPTARPFTLDQTSAQSGRNIPRCRALLEGFGVTLRMARLRRRWLLVLPGRSSSFDHLPI